MTEHLLQISSLLGSSHHFVASATTEISQAEAPVFSDEDEVELSPRSLVIQLRSLPPADQRR
jgi:hypothetical protein